MPNNLVRRRVLGSRPTAQLVSTQSLGFFGFATPDGEWDGSTEASDYVTVNANHLRSDARQSVLGGGDWSSFDDTLAECQAAGLPIIPILMPNTDLSDSTERSSFATYCGNFMARYAGKCLAVEICNEPNIAATAILRADYALALPSVHAAIRTYDATVPILAGSLGSVENDSGGHQGADEFLQHLYDQNTGQYFDGVSYHAYTGSGNWPGHEGDSWHSAAILTALRAIQVAAGFSNHLIWITETGIYSDLAAVAPVEAFQRQFLLDVKADFESRKYIAPYVSWYTHRNRVAESGTEDRFGLKRWSGAAKQAWHEFGAINAHAKDSTPAFEHDKGGGNTTINIFRRFLDATSPVQASLTFAFVGSPPTGVAINATTGVITITDASVTPAAAASLTVRATHTNGTIADFGFTLTIYHPNLISNNNFYSSGNVTGWEAIPSNATVTYDAGQGALLCDITGSGGGWRLTTGVTVTTAVHQRGILLKKGTYGGTLLNIFVDNLATTPATLTITDDYAWHWFDYTTLDTNAAVSAARNGAFTGTVYVLREVLRLKL